MPIDSNNVVKVIISNDKNEILVLLRTDNGKYDLPGGHLHVGENEIMGAIREVFEETKLVLLQIEEIIKYKRKIMFKSNSYASLGKTEEIELDLNENKDYIWLSEDKFIELPDRNSTDVVTAYKAFILEDKKFWDKLR